MTLMPDPATGSRWVASDTGPPGSILTAVKLMYAGAILEIVNVIWSIVRIGSFTRVLVSERGFTTSQAHSIATHDAIMVVAGGLLGVGLWLWMARASAAGRYWTRTIATALFACNMLAVLLILPEQGLGGILMSGVIWLVALAALLCLRRRDSSRYFSQRRRDLTQQLAPTRYL